MLLQKGQIMLKITVKNQSLGLSEEVIAENSAEFAVFSASFSSEWDGFEKTVRFRHAEGNTVYDVANVTENGEYFIPSEVLHRGRVYVSCVGVKGAGSIATSTRESFEVKGSLITSEGTVPTVTPNAYAQYVALVKDRADEVNDAAERAQKYANEAQVSRDSAFVSSVNAEKSERSARLAQERSEGYASRALVSETSAKSALNIIMGQMSGLEEKCMEKKAELDEYAHTKKGDIDSYAEKTCLEVADYADMLKKDFSADASMITTSFDVNYASKSDLLSQKAEGFISQMSQYTDEAEKSAVASQGYAREAEDSAYSASVCKNQTLNALSSALQCEQNVADHVENAASSAQIASEKAAEANSKLGEMLNISSSFYTREQADKRFDNAYYSFKRGAALCLDDADTEVELKSFTVYGNTERSHIPSSLDPCEITSFDGRVIFCGDNILDIDKCEFNNITREGETLTAQLSAGSIANIYMENIIPFLRAGEEYTLTLKTTSALKTERMILTVGNTEYSAYAYSGFITFRVPYAWDRSVFRIALSCFEDESRLTKRTRTYTNFGINRGSSPVYEPYNMRVLSTDCVLNGIPVYNGKNGNPADRICDSIEYRDGVLKYIRRIGKYVFDGKSTENWSYLSGWDRDDMVGFYCKVPGKGNYPVICNRFDYNGTDSESTSEQVACSGSTDCVYVQIKKSSIDGWGSSLSYERKRTLMKNWTVTHNIIVYFVLKEPEETVLSTNLIFPDKNIFCTFPGVTFEAEYKPLRNNGYACTVTNEVSGKRLEIISGADNMGLEGFSMKGITVQSAPTADEPQNINGFGNAVIVFCGKNRSNSHVYTGRYAKYRDGMIQVELPSGQNHAILYDETLNYTLEGSKTYTLTVECGTEPMEGEKIGIDINGTVFYSEEKSRSVTFEMPDGVRENKVKIYLCHLDTPTEAPQHRTYGGLRVVEGVTAGEFCPYNGSLVFLKDSLETGSTTTNGFLRACGDVYDRIYLKNGRMMLEKNVEYVVCKDSDEYHFVSETTDTALFRYVPENYKKGIIYCSHFPVITREQLDGGIAEGAFSDDDGILIRIKTERIEYYEEMTSEDEKIEGFAAWMDDEAVAIQYMSRYGGLYDVSVSNFAKSIAKIRTCREPVTVSSVFDRGSEKAGVGTVQGEISLAYPCDIAEFVKFKTAEAIR